MMYFNWFARVHLINQDFDIWKTAGSTCIIYLTPSEIPRSPMQMTWQFSDLNIT